MQPISTELSKKPVTKTIPNTIPSSSAGVMNIFISSIVRKPVELVVSFLITKTGLILCIADLFPTARRHFIANNCQIKSIVPGKNYLLLYKTVVELSSRPISPSSNAVKIPSMETDKDSFNSIVVDATWNLT